MPRSLSHGVKQILCPVDFDEPNEAANQFASMLAKTCNATLVYLYCACPDIVLGKYEFNELKKEEADCLQKLRTIKPAMRGIKTRYEIEFGISSERIVEFAGQNDMDMIVIGTHGRKGIGRMIMGSVAEDVIRNSDCPVVAVKHDAYVPSSRC